MLRRAVEQPGQENDVRRVIGQHPGQGLHVTTLCRHRDIINTDTRVFSTERSTDLLRLGLPDRRSLTR